MLQNNKIILYTFGVSLLAHLLIFYVMTRSTQHPEISQTPPDEQVVIKAKLIFAEAAKPEPAVKEEEQEQVDPEPQPETPMPPELPIEPAPTDIEPIAEAPAPTAKQSDEPVPELENKPSPQANNDFMTQSAQAKLQSAATNLARKHLSYFQQQQQTQLAELAANEFQQQKHAAIEAPTDQNRFLSEEQVLMKSLTVQADCSSATKRTAAVLLNLLGGAFDCSNPPPIDSFIQKRLNKQVLPVSNSEPVKNPTQSIVIQNQ
ncbi:hypothetical protein [Paraglaciecola aestuariivivens]